MTTARSTTRAEDVYLRLRADILNGRHEPGSRLRVEVLRERYDVSSGVLREALPRLVGQGLATFAPQQGFRVVAVSPDRLRDLTEARVVIETHVAREAIVHGSIEWESNLLAAHHNLARTPLFLDGSDEINERWLIAHARFHLALLAGCPNQQLQAIATQLRESAEVYRCWSRPPAHHTRDVAAEHQLICERAIARDAPGTLEALTHHIELTTQILLERSQEDTHPDSTATLPPG